MKRLVLQAPEQFQMEEAVWHFPTAPSEEPTAVVQVRYVALCGSDYALFHGRYQGPHSYPLILGHEWVGEVLSVLGDSKKVQVRHWVTGDCSAWGIKKFGCIQCTHDKNLCPHVEKFGITRNGFLQQLVQVPIRYLYPLPKSQDYLPYVLTELTAVAIYGLQKIECLWMQAEENTCLYQSKNRRILLVGAGPLGLSAANYLHHQMGVSIDFWEQSREKRERFRKRFPEFRFLEEVPSVKSENYGTLLQRTPYTLVLETSGSVSGIETAVQNATPGGIVLLYGMYPPKAIPMKTVVCKGLLLQGTIGGTGAFPDAIRFYKKYPAVAKRLITELLPFDAERIGTAMQRRTTTSLKAVISLQELP